MGFIRGKIVGNCSNCGGSVVQPSDWLGMYAPPPTCEGCGAIAKQPELSIINMNLPPASYYERELQYHPKKN